MKLRSAMLYALLGTCKLHEVNPMVWLTDVLERITHQPKDRTHELLPHHWKKHNPEKASNDPQPAIIRVAKST